MSIVSNYLFVSYAAISKDNTSWVDVISMRELFRSVAVKKRTAVKIASLNSFRFSKADCDSAFKILKDDEGIRLEFTLDFNESPANTESDIELGTMVITWNYDKDITPEEASRADFVEAVISKTPQSIRYQAKGSKDILSPTYAFLHHKDNDGGYFLYASPRGSVMPKYEIFHKKEFEEIIKNYKKETVDEVYGHIVSKVEERAEFSAGTLFPNPWPKEIMPLYDELFQKTNDQTYSFEHAAYALSGLVQMAIMASDYEFSAGKVVLPGRKFGTLYFHNTGKLKN